jgi:hypothetical protein
MTKHPVTQADRDIGQVRTISELLATYLTASTIEAAHEADPSSYYPVYSGEERVQGSGVEWSDPTSAVALQDRRYKLSPRMARAGEMILRARILLEDAASIVASECVTANWRQCCDCVFFGPLAAKNRCRPCYQRWWRGEKKKDANTAAVRAERDKHPLRTP